MHAVRRGQLIGLVLNDIKEITALALELMKAVTSLGQLRTISSCISQYPHSD